MGRPVLYVEFTHAAVRLVRERGVSVSRAAKDLGLHEGIVQRAELRPRLRL